MDPHSQLIGRIIERRYATLAVSKKKVSAEIDALYKRYILNFPDDSLDKGTNVVHADLHPGNIIFNGSNEMIGVIDFTDTIVANAYYDLRRIAGIGEDVLGHIIDDLSPSFGEVSLDKLFTMRNLYECLQG